VQRVDQRSALILQPFALSRVAAVQVWLAHRTPPTSRSPFQKQLSSIEAAVKVWLIVALR